MLTKEKMDTCLKRVESILEEKVESFFKKIIANFNMAAKNIQEMEIKNKELQRNVNDLQNKLENIKNEQKSVLSSNAQFMIDIVKKHEKENKELCEKLSLARKEIHEYKKEKEEMLKENENFILILAEKELELQRSKLLNKQLSNNIEKLKDKK